LRTFLLGLALAISDHLQAFILNQQKQRLRSYFKLTVTWLPRHRILLQIVLVSSAVQHIYVV